MTVTVNGVNEEIPEGSTIRQLIAAHRLTPEKVAIELNKRLVRSKDYDRALSPDDAVEIVTFVGGG